VSPAKKATDVEIKHWKIFSTRGTEEKSLLLVGFKHVTMQSSSLTENASSQSVNDKWNLIQQN